MYKKIIIALMALLFLASYVSAQDIYHDGNFSNGEYIDFPPLNKSIFIRGDITNLKTDSALSGKYTSAKIEMEIINEVSIKSLFSNTFTIKEKGQLTLIFDSREGDERENVYFYDLEEKKKFSLSTESKGLRVDFVGNSLVIKKENQIVLKLISSQINDVGIDISKNGSVSGLELFPSVQFPIIDGYAKLEKNGRVTADYWKETNYFEPCPKISLVDGGILVITNNSFMFKPEGKVLYFEMSFIPRENLIFKLEKIDEVYGCLQKFSVKELEKTGDIRGIKQIEGKFFTIEERAQRRIKILDGNLEIDGTKIEGKDIYFFENLDNFKDFDRNKALKEKNSGVWFDSETASLVVTDNFDKTITINGQKVKFDGGKPIKTSLDLAEFYEIVEKREGTRAEFSEMLQRASKIAAPTTCEEMGGEWKDEEKGCNLRFEEGNMEVSYIIPAVGKAFNELSEAKPKIIDYRKGKICCLKVRFEPVQRLIYKKQGEAFCAEVSWSTVGRNIFTAPEGTIIVDIAPQFLKQDIDEAKTDIFDPKSIDKIPSEIKPTDLLTDLPPYLGIYFPGKIEITRKAIMRKRSVLTHEILHHFYMNEGKGDPFKERFRRYLSDNSLDEKESKTREILVKELGWWKEYYNPATEEEWFEYMSNEGHSVIGQWLYEKYKNGVFFVRGELGGYLPEESELKFPSYILELYEGILRPEIIEQER